MVPGWVRDAVLGPHLQSATVTGYGVNPVKEPQTRAIPHAMQSNEDFWIESEREHAERYLREQHVGHLGVGEYPAFHVHPYFALWAVQSKRAPGSVGWWVITGDLPADYISSSEGRHPREALRAFSRHWLEVSSYMLRGESHPDYAIGTPDQSAELGDLLRRRAKIIGEYADNVDIWTEE